MIQEAFTYVDQVTDMDTKLKLIDTLITVTAGKVRQDLQQILNITVRDEHWISHKKNKNVFI